MATLFRVILEGDQETPPNSSAASGVGTVIFDREAVAASYSFDVQGVDFGLTPPVGGPAQTPATDDDVTRTHFHTQVAGLAGPIVFGQIDPNPALVQDNDDLAIVLNADGSWSMSGRWETTDPPARVAFQSPTSLPLWLRPRPDRRCLSISMSIRASSPGARSAVN
jgi:serralysin